MLCLVCGHDNGRRHCRGSRCSGEELDVAGEELDVAEEELDVAGEELGVDSVDESEHPAENRNALSWIMSRTPTTAGLFI